MNDEEYLFFSDCAEKKSIGASSFRKRTHTGKGGRVRFPSDSLTKKELEKMNGETKSYRLNEPMSWAEFRAMPDDVKVMYINLLRQKFNPSARRIADMMGTNTYNISVEFTRLGINEGKNKRNGSTPWDSEGWYAWCGLSPKPAKEKPEVEKILEEVPLTQKSIEQIVEETLVEEEPVAERHVCMCREERKKVVPMTGNMVFEGLAEDVAEMMRVFLGGANVRISISWDVHENLN